MKYEDTVTAVNRVIEQYTMPLTLRQIYYRLVAAGLIPNQRSAYNALSSQLVTAREQGEVNEYRIVDRSRSITDLSFDSPTAFFRVVQQTLRSHYLRRFWTSQETYVELWVEKDALSAVLAGAIREFNTIVAPSRGYSSFSYLRSAASRITKYAEDKLTAVILHFADHDPSGLDMTRDLEDRLNHYCDRPVSVQRVALTFDQVRQYSLIPNPTKATDPRSSDYIALYGNECWELDAVEPDELVRLCQEAVEEHITDPDAWEEAKQKERTERDNIRRHLDQLSEEMPDEDSDEAED